MEDMSIDCFEFIVADSGIRVDRYLSQCLPELSRSRVQKLIEEGHLSLNQEICTSKKVVLQVGDRVRMTIPDVQPLMLSAENIPLDILYEDEHLLIVNKPAGLVVHPAPGHAGGTLVNALLAHCQDLAGIGGVQRPGIVHRLDKDTTGALVVAKTDFVHQELQAQLKAKTARREYLGLVFGCPRTEQGVVDQPLGRHPVDRKKMAIISVEKGGRNAVTHWEIRERIGNYTLMLFRLETGRTHQIRVHSAFLGHPLVGDPLYSAGKSLGIKMTGQVLHAWKLKLVHPVTRQELEVIAEPPPEFYKVLELLRKRR